MMPSAISQWDIFQNSLADVREKLNDVPRWVWAGVCVFGTVAYLKVKYQRTYREWEKQNIPGPKPYLFSGTNHLLAQYKSFHEMNTALCAKYGSKGYFGTYEGAMPVLVVTDPEIIKEVMIKQFDVFPNRRTRASIGLKYMRKIISVMQHEEWRRTRNALTPTFTGAKLKKLVSLMDDVSDNFSRKLGTLTKSGCEEVELKPLFKAFSMDVICNVVFGLKVDTQSDPENAIAQSCFRMMEQNQRLAKKPLLILAFIFPDLIGFLQRIDPTLGLNMDAASIVDRKLLSILENRRLMDENDGRPFFLGTLIEMIELHQRSNGSEGFDFETAVAQALAFLLAGFDTTSNLLMWACYYFAMYPHFQEEVREEIENVLGPGVKKAPYESLASMKRLENFLMETLRLRPVIRTQRQAVRDTIIGPGIRIKAGWSVDIPPNVIHMDPRIWDEPEKFRPQRFDPDEASKRSPYAFNAFGVGPRNCIGMRLALMEAKIAVIGLLTDYRLNMGNDTPTKITEFARSQFFEPLTPIRLKLSKR